MVENVSTRTPHPAPQSPLMIRTIGWCLLGLLGLAVVAALSLEATEADGLEGVLGRLSMKNSSAGLGYDDGRLVWREMEPHRITVEQLPSLDNRRRGYSWNSGFFMARMSWFGVSLRQAIAHCLDSSTTRVLGDESLDRFWFDVDAAQPKSITDSGISGWEPVKARILEGLCEHYGVTIVMEGEQTDTPVARVTGVARTPPHLTEGGEAEALTSGSRDGAAPAPARR